MNMMDRRALLNSKDNPGRKLDYVITLAGNLPTCNQARKIVLRYIPDREILDAEAFGHYLQAVEKTQWDTPEDLAVTLLTDVNNEIVARWVQVSLSAPKNQDGIVSTHGVVLEDRQPGWDNRTLLGRLDRI
ncbi:MAG: hypothetical protein JKY17_08880 [Magnetovibrio sp.]|nr:hypothetical protein [Magnetovibrio sp.]